MSEAHRPLLEVEGALHAPSGAGRIGRSGAQCLGRREEVDLRGVGVAGSALQLAEQPRVHGKECLDVTHLSQPSEERLTFVAVQHELLTPAVATAATCR